MRLRGAAGSSRGLARPVQAHCGVLWHGARELVTLPGALGEGVGNGQGSGPLPWWGTQWTGQDPHGRGQTGLGKSLVISLMGGACGVCPPGTGPQAPQMASSGGGD